MAINIDNPKLRDNRDTIVSLLLETNRDGMECVIRYLDDSGFFIVPSSIDRHHNWQGGLAEHSLGVYRLAQKEAGDLPQDSVVIAGLLHDVCKAAKLYYDEDGVLHHRHTHIHGHGYRSIKILEQCGLKLTEDERSAIRWHMGGHHANTDERDEVMKARQSRLWQVIHRADHLDASKGWR